MFSTFNFNLTVSCRLCLLEKLLICGWVFNIKYDMYLVYILVVIIGTFPEPLALSR